MAFNRDSWRAQFFLILTLRSMARWSLDVLEEKSPSASFLIQRRMRPTDTPIIRCTWTISKAATQEWRLISEEGMPISSYAVSYGRISKSIHCSCRQSTEADSRMPFRERLGPLSGFPPGERRSLSKTSSSSATWFMLNSFWQRVQISHSLQRRRVRLKSKSTARPH